METVEAIGLWRRKVWAEWLVIVVTASFLPFEVWELIRQPAPIKLAALVLNVAVLVYLVRRRQHRPDRPASAIAAITNASQIAPAR